MFHFKHLVLEDRITIQSDLHDGLSFKKIASHINHDCTTVSSEIRNHLTVIDDMWPTNCKQCFNRHLQHQPHKIHLTEYSTHTESHRPALRATRSIMWSHPIY